MICFKGKGVDKKYTMFFVHTFLLVKKITNITVTSRHAQESKKYSNPVN